MTIERSRQIPPRTAAPGLPIHSVLEVDVTGILVPFLLWSQGSRAGAQHLPQLSSAFAPVIGREVLPSGGSA